MHNPSAASERMVSPHLKSSTLKSDRNQISSLGQSLMRHLLARQTSALGTVLLFVGLLLVAFPGVVTAAEVTLVWQPNNTNESGYRVYQRQEGEIYDYATPVWSDESKTNSKNTCTIGGLAEDTTYYFVVRACVGDSLSNDSNEVQFNTSSMNSNHKPVASAGPNQVVKENSTVNLNGGDSFDLDGDPLSYQFKQLAGPDVNLNCQDAKCSFTAPDVPRTTALLFELTVGDGSALFDKDTTIVLIDPVKAGQDDGSAPITEDTGDSKFMTNQAPYQPSLTEPIDGSYDVDLTPWIGASSFGDADAGDNHLLTQWHILDDTTQKDVMDLISTQGHLTSLKLLHLILDPSTKYSARVRYFDNKGLASDWSAPAVFTTGDDSRDLDKDKIPDDREVSIHTDMNNDGIADIEQPNVIKSVSSFNGKYLMGVVISGGDKHIRIDGVSNIDPNTWEIPVKSGDQFPFGVLAYKIQVPEPGQSVDTTIYFSDPIDQNRVLWTRYDGINGWKDSSGTAIFDTEGYVVERRLTDGGEEDADGVANGLIIDLSGPMYPSSMRSSLTSDDDPAASGGGGGGCFIHSFF